MTGERALKTITQETFDIVVKENIEEFEMDEEEAVKDAIEQFHSQGVNVNIIIKELPKDNGKHIVATLVDSLSRAVEDDKLAAESTQKILTQLSRQFTESLSKRYQACKLANASDVIFKACEAFSKKDVFVLALINGQPDEITGERLQFFVQELKNRENEDILHIILQIIKQASTKHEDNRQALVKMDVIPILLRTIEQYSDCKNVLREGCIALRTLTLDDDIRVSYGKAHEHAKLIVLDEGLKRLIKTFEEHCRDGGLAKEFASTLSKVMVRNEFCQEFVDLGGFSVIKDLVELHSNNSALIKQCVNLMQAVSGNDDVKVHLVKHGGIEILHNILDEYIANAGICEACFFALTTLSLRNPNHCKLIMEKGIAPMVIQAMNIHTEQAGVQKQACMLIRNLVARTREYTCIFLELGVEELIRTVRKLHSASLEDESKAALRDLDLDVDLKQLWTGKNSGLSN